MKERYLALALLAASFIAIVGLATYSAAFFNQTRYPLLAQTSGLQEGWTHTANVSKLQQNIGTYLNTVNVPHSFYASHLQSGTPVKARERNVHVAASLLKLPVVMNVMRQVDLGNVNLDQQIKVKSHFKDSRYGSLYKKPTGTHVSVREALRLSLVDSDNTAHNLLRSLPTGMSDSESILKTLNIDTSLNAQTETLIDTQSYAQLLRCLYFSCYLSKNSSQKVLELMQESPAGGISVGLPQNTKVAHKIGVAGDTKSDCGIVYAGNNSYIFCIMLDTNRKKAGEITANVSRLVYRAFVTNTESD